MHPGKKHNHWFLILMFAAVLTLAGCRLELPFGKLLPGDANSSSDSTDGKGDWTDELVSSVEVQNFPLCAWVGAALDQGEPLDILLEPTSVLEDPVRSEPLIAQEVGSEESKAIGTMTQVSCLAEAQAADPSYDGFLSGSLLITLQVDPMGLEGDIEFDALSDAIRIKVETHDGAGSVIAS